VLASLTRREQELVEQTLENHPSLTIDEALEILKYLGGL
jgi:DNA-binding CsgD family transcriptional regulator